MTAAEYNKRKKEELEKGAASGVSTAPSSYTAYTPTGTMTAAEYNAFKRQYGANASLPSAEAEWSDVPSELVTYQKAVAKIEAEREEEERRDNRLLQGDRWQHTIYGAEPDPVFTPSAQTKVAAREYDLNNAQKAAEEAKKEADRAKAEAPSRNGRRGEIPTADQARAQSDLFKANQDVSTASAALQLAKWDAELETMTKAAVNDPQFSSYAASGSYEGNPTLAEADKVHLARRVYDGMTPGDYGNEEYGTYRHMSKDEVKVYDYWLGKEKRGEADAGTAARYLSLLEDTLNRRQAGEYYEAIGGKNAGLLTQWGVKAQTGFDQFGSGVKNTFGAVVNPNGIPSTSARQYLGAQVQSDLKQKGWMPALVGDLITTTTNMLPSIAAAALVGKYAAPALGASAAGAQKAGEIAGQAVMGAGVFGNAYNEMRLQGYTAGQSALYASMNTASELALEKLLNGIAAQGVKSVSGETIEELVKTVNNATAQWWLRFGMEAASEGIEEFTQDVIDPLLKGFATGDFSEKVDLKQALYSGILGALNAGVLNGAEHFGTQAITLTSAREINKNGGAAKAVELGQSYSAETIAGRLARQLSGQTDASGNIKVSSFDLAKLIYYEGAEIADQTKADIAEELHARGYAKENAEDVAEIIAAAVLEGPDKLSRAQAAILSADETISDVLFDTIIGRNTTVNERIANYNEVMSGRAQAVTRANESGVELGEIGAQTERSRNGVSETAAQSYATEAVGTKTDTAREERAKNAAEIRAVTREAAAEIAKEVGLSADKVNAVAEIMARESTAEAIEASGLDAETAVRGIQQAARYGVLGAERSAWSAKSDAVKLPEAVADAVYKIAHGETDGKKTGQRGTFEMPKNYAQLNKRQKVSVQFARRMHDLGIVSQNIRFYSSVRDDAGNLVYAEDVAGLGKKGERAKNGGYSYGANTIWIDLNAGDSGEGLVVGTLAHELTHAIRATDAAQFRKLADAVAKVAVKYGIDLDAEVLRKMGNDGLNYTDAAEDVVCDAVSRIWTENTDAVRALGEELAMRDKTLAEKVKGFFRKVATALRKLYRDTNIIRSERDRLAALCAQADEVVKAFTEGVAGMTRDVAAEATAVSETRSEKEKAPSGEDVKWSIRRTSRGDVVVLDEDITKKKPSNQRYTDYIKGYLADVFSEDSYLSSLPESGFSVYTHEDLPEEYTDSVYTKYLRNRKQDRFYAKMRAAGSLAELVQIATGRTWEPAKHKDNKDAKYGVYKYNSRFAYPIETSTGSTSEYKAYTCDLVIINASNGKKYLYDVQNIKEDAVTAGELSKMDTRKGKAQLKSVFESNDTTSSAESQEGEAKKTKFSLREPVEETKTLVALHNLSAEKLEKALDLGGFPMPSIAVVKSDQGHATYGDISIVFGRDTIDPTLDARNAIYQGDAWTPTVPRAEYEVNDSVAKALSNRYYEMKEKYGDAAYLGLYDYAVTPEYAMNRLGGEKGIFEKAKNSFYTMKLFLHDTGHDVPAVDFYDDPAAYDAIKRLVDDAKYEKWLHKLFDGLEKSKGIRNNKDTVTRSGKRRSFKALHYDYTLDGIVRAMLEGQAKHGEGNEVGAPGFYNETQRSFKSIDDARDASGLIRGTSVYSEEIYEKRNAFVEKVQGLINQLNEIGTDEWAEEALIDIIHKHKTAGSIYNAMLEAGFTRNTKEARRLSGEAAALIKEAQTLPVPYFEAKPYRAVRFDEVKAAVVPEGTDSGLIGRLKDAGVPEVLTYRKGDDADRLAKVNSVEGIRFSKRTSQRDSEYMRAVDSGDVKTQERLVGEAAREAGYTVRAYHGTKADFTIFDIRRSGKNFDGWSQYGKGFYFAPTEKGAIRWTETANGGKAKVMAVYLPNGDYVYASRLLPWDVLNALERNTQWLAIDKSIRDRIVKWKAKDALSSLRMHGIDVRKLLKRLDYEGIKDLSKGYEQYVVFDPEQVKSADPVTYDDAGNVIPLSERFNAEKGDIRWSQRTKEPEVVDLSDDTELAKRVEGLHGSAKYNIIKEYILSVLGGKDIVFPDKLHAVVDGGDAQHLSHKAGDKKTAQIAKLLELIDNSVYWAWEDSEDIDDKFNSFRYYRVMIQYGGERYPVYLNVGTAKNDGTYHLHDITKKLRVTAHRITSDVGRLDETEGTISEARHKNENSQRGNDTTNRAESQEGTIKKSSRDQTIIEARKAKARIRASIARDFETLHKYISLAKSEGKEVTLDPKSVKDVALRVANGDKTTALAVAAAYRKMYAQFKKSEGYSWEDFRADAQDAAERIAYDAYEGIAAAQAEDTREEDYDIAAALRGSRVSFSENDKKELRAAFGKDWMRLVMGKIKVVPWTGSSPTAKDVFASLSAEIGEYGKWMPRGEEARDGAAGAVNLVRMLNSMERKSGKPTGKISALDSDVGRTRVNDAMMEELTEQAYADIWDGYCELTTEKTASDSARETAEKLEADFEELRKTEKDVSAERFAELLARMDEKIRETRESDKAALEHTKEKLLRRLEEERMKARWEVAGLRKDISDIREKDAEALRQKVAEVREKYRENALRKEYKKKIRETVSELQKWFVKPDLKKRKLVPDVLKEPVGKLLTSLDFLTEGVTESGKPTSVKNADMMIAQRMESVREAMKKYRADVGEYSGFFDGGTELMDELEHAAGAINALAAAAKSGEETAVSRMNSEELARLYRIVKLTEAFVTKTNSLLADELHRHVGEIGQSAVRSMLAVAGKDGGALGKLAETKAGRFALWKDIRPYAIFDRFGEGGRILFNELEDAYDRLGVLAKQIVDFTNKTYDEKTAKRLRDTVISVELDDGQTVNMRLSQAMFLYLSYNDADARRHILSENGGFRVQNFEANGKNYADHGHRITSGDVQRIIAEMDKVDPKARKIADELHRFAIEYCAAWKNEIDLKRFGVFTATNPDYISIFADRSQAGSPQTEGEDGTEKIPDSAAMYALLNASFHKARNEKADNRIVMYDVLEWFANYAGSMAQYNAFALPILDTIKFLNYNYQQERYTTDENGNSIVARDEGGKVVYDTYSVREAMERAYGTPPQNVGRSGIGYAEMAVRNLIMSLNGTESRGDEIEQLPIRVLKRYNASRVAANLSTAAKQPISALRALYALQDYYSGQDGGDAKGTLAKAAKALKDGYSFKSREEYEKAREEMYRNSGIAVWKSLGFYDVNISRGMKRLALKDASVVDKALEKGMLLAEKADEVTWVCLWNASRKATGSVEEAHDLFNKIIYETQVVDTSITRSELMRSKNYLAKSVSSFMGEPVTEATMLINAAENVVRARKTGNAKAISASVQKFKTAVVSHVIAAAVESFVSAAFSAIRDDDDDKTILEKFANRYETYLLQNLSFTRLLPIGKAALETAEYILFQFDTIDKAAEKLGYDPYTNEPSNPLTEVISSVVSLIDVAKKKYGEGSNHYTNFSVVKQALQLIAETTGIPADSLARWIVTPYNLAWDIVNQPQHKLKSYISTAEQQHNLIEAMQQGDTTKFRALTNDYWKGNAEKTKEGVRSAIRETYYVGEISRTTAEFMLERYDGYDAKEAVNVVDGWDRNLEKKKAK